MPRPTLLLVALVIACAGCPWQTPEPAGPAHPNKLVSCASQAVQTCAADAVPAVNECLAGAGSITACLLGLIQPAGCLTYQVIACVTRHEGAAARAAATGNHANARDAARAARARKYLEDEAITFAEPDPAGSP